MTDHAIKQYLSQLPEVSVDYPFGPEVEVYRIVHKMFGLYSIGAHGLGQLNLKCEPNKALMLRDIFAAVIPGYHMNKKHWNTVILDGSVPTPDLTRMIDNSYRLVIESLAQREQTSLQLRNADAPIFLSTLREAP